MTGHPCGHGRFEGGQGLEQPGWANEAFANEAFANLLTFSSLSPCYDDLSSSPCGAGGL